MCGSNKEIKTLNHSNIKNLKKLNKQNSTKIDLVYYF